MTSDVAIFPCFTSSSPSIKLFFSFPTAELGEVSLGEYLKKSFNDDWSEASFARFLWDEDDAWARLDIAADA